MTKKKQERTVGNQKSFLKVFTSEFEHLGLHAAIMRSCQITGVARRTYYHWSETDEDFAEKIEGIVVGHDTVEKVEASLLRAALAGDTQAMIHWLGREKDSGKRSERRREVLIGEIEKLNQTVRTVLRLLQEVHEESVKSVAAVTDVEEVAPPAKF